MLISRLQKKKLICEAQKTEGRFQGVFFKAKKLANIKAAPPPAVIAINQKVPRDNVFYFVEKFKLLAKFVLS